MAKIWKFWTLIFILYLWFHVICLNKQRSCSILRVRIPCLFEIRGSIRDIFLYTIKKGSCTILDIFNNYLRLRSTTTATGKLHGAISKYIYNMIFKAHLITANRLSELNFFVYMKCCQHSMFYTNKMFWTRSQV